MFIGLLLSRAEKQVGVLSTESVELIRFRFTLFERLSKSPRGRSLTN